MILLVQIRLCISMEVPGRRGRSRHPDRMVGSSSCLVTNACAKTFNIVETVVISPCTGPVCLCCYVDDDDGAITFHESYLANVSIDMSKYETTNSLQL